MKKLLVIAMVGLVGAASADYFVNYSSYWGNTVDGAPMLPNVGNTATVQLLYAGANGVADETEPGKLDLSLIAGDDVLLYSATFENTGGAYEEFAAGTYGTFDGAAFLGGAIYGRIFNSAAPGAGSRYFIGDVITALDLDSGASPAPTPTKYDMVAASVGASGEAAGVVIPEPATIGLMGIAGLGMFLARRKTRR